MNAHLQLPAIPWLWAVTLGETFGAGLDPAGTGRRLRDARLARLIESAATESPFYQSRMAATAGAQTRLADLEPVDKHTLMAQFDAWATDRRITRDSVEAFLADPDRLADAYLGDYLIWTSSGTSGEPGIFVQDAQSLAAYDALDMLRLRGVDPRQLPLAAWSAGQRFAFVAATGGHFAGVASIERLRRIATSMFAAPWQWLAPLARVFSVLDPLDDLARGLQDFAPTVLITYPSCAAALARRQLDGALRLNLAEAWLGGEQLTGAQRASIIAAFGCALRNNYGASEFYSMAWECRHGRLHLNDDWLVLEPVDRQLRPVRAGEPGQAALLTNLANRVQPLLRYRLDDSVRLDVEPCPCGCAFPVIEIHGRSDQTLVLHDAARRAVTLLPLALSTVIEEGAQVSQFQLLGTAPDALELRFDAGVADPAAAFERARLALAAFLLRQGLPNVRIARGLDTPLQNPSSGKVCRVLAQRHPRGLAAHQDGG